MSQAQLILTYIIVTLTDMMLHGDPVPEGTMLEVEKGLRDDWRGSRIARDATDEEIANYRDEQGGVEDVIDDKIQELARQRGDLEDLLHQLELQKTALTAEVDVLGESKQELAAEVEALDESKQALTVEVEALKAAAAAAKKAAK